MFRTAFSRLVNVFQSNEAEQEPNEAIDEANHMAIPGVRSGSAKYGDAATYEYQYVNGPKDKIEDFYKFVIPTNTTRRLDISLTFNNAAADLDLLLFKLVNNQLQAVAVSNGSGTTERITPIITLDEGTYFLGVSAFDDPGNTSPANYAVSVTPDVQPPPPAITALVPQAVTAGGGPFSITVSGNNFLPGQSVVRWNGANRSTTFINSNQLVAFLTAADIANAGSGSVTVFNPPSLGGSSAATSFTIAPAGTPEPEVEPNETSAQANLLLASGKRSGNVSVGDPSAFTIQLYNNLSDPIEDVYAVNLPQSARLDLLLTGANSGSHLALYLLKELGPNSFSVIGNSRMSGPMQRVTTPQMLSAGRYLVGVSGVMGASSYTIQASIPGNRLLQVNTNSAAPNSTVTVPVSFFAEGNENTLNFSLKYNTAILGNPQVVAGSDLAGATLTVDTSQAGRIGVQAKLAAGEKLSAGARELVRVTFSIAPSPASGSTKIEFTDAPVVPGIIDAAGNAVIGTYADGVVIVVPGVEADVSPRPLGSGDGVVSIADWTQVGRFVSGTDIPADGSEFQRADCAPRATLGDGRLTIADWVMAGRYVAGLESIASAGGPAEAILPAFAFEKSMAQTEPEQQGRIVRINPATFNRGQANDAFVELNAQGNENAVGFSVNFDTTQMTFTGASLGTDAAGSILNINTNQIAQGRIGIGLALPSGQTFPAGVRQILKLSFTVPQSSPVNATTLSFGDLPIAREIVDPNAGALTATYTAGEITLTPQVTSTPTIASLSPASVVVGGPSFTLTVNGVDFINGAFVRVNGAARVTEYVNATQLRATILAQDIGETGAVSITVQNPAPSGGISNALSLPIVNPAPSIGSINPQAAAVGGVSFTLTVTGSNFVPGAIVQWNGVNRITTFLNVSQLSAQIPASDLQTAGTATIRVVNPEPGGGPSNTVDFPVQAPNPIPRITTISPNSVEAGGPGFTLTVNGTGFATNSVVRFNGNAVATTFVSATQLTVSVSAADIANAGTASVTVFTPTPGGGASNAALLSISVPPNPVPAITSLAPASITAGGQNFSLTVTGSNFVQGSIVRFDGQDRPTTYISATEIRAQISAADIVNGGMATITVFNPAPAGGTSNSRTLTINFAAPMITQLSPTSTVAGGPAFQLTVLGTNLAPGSIVRWNGQDRVTQFVSVTEIVAQITAADIANVGTASVVVFSPPPGGGTSNAVTFMINQAARPVPRITSLSPKEATINGPAFTLTVNGTNFASDSVVRWNGQVRPTTFVGSTQVTAQIPASDLAALGNVTVTVFTPPAGGGESNPATFTVNQAPNPLPQVTTINPTSVSAGGPAFALTVNGTGFVPSSVVLVNGANRGTTFLATTQLVAQVLPSDILESGPVSIRVISPAPGGGTSNEIALTVINPTPAITAINPTVVAEGSAAFTLTVTGTGFVPGAQIVVNNAPRITTFLNGTTLTTQIPASDAAAAATLSVQVVNPPPGGGLSNVVSLEVRRRNPIPRLTSISPDTASAGGNGFTLVVTGTGFVRGSVVRVNGQERVTDFVSETALAAQITAADIASGGVLQISIFNAAPGGGSSGALPLTVRNPVPGITSVSPDNAVAGSIGFTMIVNGSGFVPTSVVRFNNEDLPATFITGSQLSVQVPASAISAGGQIPIVVINPSPGGGSSNVATFAIANPASVITSLNPSQVLVGGPAFTLTINGSGFVNGSVVRVNNQDRPTNFISGSQLSVQILAADIATTGALTIVVATPPPGGGLSNTVALTAVNALPSISNIDPAAVNVGSIAFPLTVNGSGFVSGAVVNWNGSPRQTTFVDGTRLIAQITAADVATAGTATVTVTNPAPGGGTSIAVVFTINSPQPNPIPTATALSPGSIVGGSAAFTLTVTGANFVPGAVVNWNDAPRVTTFVSSTQLQAQITAGDVFTAGLAAVTVTNPAPGGGTTSPLNFVITPPNPVPVLSGLVPASASVGSPTFTLTLNGAGFVQGSVVNWNGSPRQTTFFSATQLFAQITAGDLENATTASITVVNPAPGGGTSNAQTFSVTFTPNPVPAITALSPTSAIAGDDAFTLTVTGTDFVAGSIVRWNGEARPTVFVSPTQLTALIVESDVANAGTATISVFNPAPGGGASNELGFVINALDCQVICLQSPQYYSLQNANRLPRGFIFIGGVNFNNPVSVQTNVDDVRRALLGGSSSLQQLNQAYDAFQLSVTAASGTFPSGAIMASSVRCYGLRFSPIALSNGFTLTRNTTLSDLLVQTRQAILENRSDDMVKITSVLAMLNGNDPSSCCLSTGCEQSGCRLHLRRHGVERAADHPDLLIGFRPILLFESLAHARQRLHAIARVKAGRVDLVLEPGPARQARRGEQFSLRLIQQGIERLHVGWKRAAARRCAKGAIKAVRRSAKLLRGGAQRSEVDAALRKPRKLLDIDAHRLREVRELERQQLRIGEPHRQRSRRLHERAAVFERPVRKARVPGERIIDRVIDSAARFTAESDIQRGNAQMIDEGRIVRPRTERPDPHIRPLAARLPASRAHPVP
ncbi:MAG: pre-peptidase C-terminal domain-containing protein [Blastocatellia bacterium]|nr:pre-peptidase C-terminal domain-containing protein [Blastocatellia bacterium]